MRFKIELLHNDPIELAHDRLAGTEGSIAYLSIYNERVMALTRRDLVDLQTVTDGALRQIVVRESKVPHIDRWGAIKVEK